MEPHQLEQRIAEFPRCHYRFEFDNGVTTPIFVPQDMSRASGNASTSTGPHTSGVIFEYAFGETFDVVLCLGLLYHVAKPFELFERIAHTGAELVVIDTAVFRASGSLYTVKREKLDHPQAAKA